MTFGPKLVPLDCKARIRRIVRNLAKELAEPGTRNLTFVVEREGSWNAQSTHRDDIDAAKALQRAVGSLSQI